MADNRMNKAARGGIMGRLRGNMNKGSGKQFRGNADGTDVDHMSDEDMGRAPVGQKQPPQQRPARRGPANYTPDETQAMVERAMSGAGNIAQGTREAWAAQSPADPDPENEADLPNFADNSQAASQRRRLGMRSRLARR